MRKMTWLRWGLASVIVAGAAGGALIAGCSDDDPPVTPRDSGADTSTDTGTDAPGPVDSGKNGRAILVHASPDLPGFRVCVAIGPKTDGTNTVSGVKPLPDELTPGSPLPYPMIPPGAGGPLPDLVDLAKVTVTPYLVLADKVKDSTKDAGSFTCTNYIGGDAGLVEGQDWWKLPDIPPGTIAKDHTYILAIEGCIQPQDAGTTPEPGATIHKLSCAGSGAASNLRIVLFDVDKAVTDQTKWGVQLANASPGVTSVFAGVAADAGGAQTFALVTSDGGPNPTVNLIATNPAVQTIGPVPAKTVAIPTADFASTFATYAVSLPDGGPPPQRIPVPILLAQTFGGVPPTTPLYKTGANFVFVLVGDPSVPSTLPNPDGGPTPVPNANGNVPHVIAFPAQLP